MTENAQAIAAQSELYDRTVDVCYSRPQMHVESPDIEEVRRIVLDRLRGHRVRIYLFGSWAKGSATRASDIDVGVLPLEPLPTGLLAEIHEALEESRVLHSVDLVDLSRAGPEFRRRVESEGTLWTG